MTYYLEEVYPQHDLITWKRSIQRMASFLAAQLTFVKILQDTYLNPSIDSEIGDLTANS